MEAFHRRQRLEEQEVRRGGDKTNNLKDLFYPYFFEQTDGGDDGDSSYHFSSVSPEGYSYSYSTTSTTTARPEVNPTTALPPPPPSQQPHPTLPPAAVVTTHRSVFGNQV